MKTNSYFLTLLALVVFLFTACDEKSDDDSTENENPPIESGISEFDLIYVNNMAIDVSTNPSLVWEGATSADGTEITYSIYIDKVSDLDDGEIPSTLVQGDWNTNLYTVQAPLVSEEEYAWYVSATDESGETRSSTSIFRFTTGAVIANQPPNSFNLLTPTNGQDDVSTNTQLTWQVATDPEGDPVKYIVFFGGAPGPTGTIASLISNTNTPANGLMESSTYYWMVLAVDNKGNTRWCDTAFSFNTEGPSAPFQATLVTEMIRGTDASDGFTGVVGNRMAILNGTIYDTGGFGIYDGDGREGNDVYKSTDGTDWIQVRPHDVDDPNGFVPSEEHQLIAYNNKLFIFNGNRNTIDWSTDGAIWNSVEWTGVVADTTHYTPRHYHQVVVFNNKIYLIGGNSGGINMTDVWVSENEGVTWARIKPNDETQWPRGYKIQVVVAGGNMYLISGHVPTDPSRSNEVWRSSDGANWTYLTTAPFSAQHGYTAVVAGDGTGWAEDIYVISGNYDNEIWKSYGGTQWTLVTKEPNNNIPYRSLHEAIYFQDEIWVFYGKGQNLSNMRSDTWSFAP